MLKETTSETTTAVDLQKTFASVMNFVSAIKEIMQKIVEFLMKVLNIKYGEDKPTVAE